MNELLNKIRLFRLRKKEVPQDLPLRSEFYSSAQMKQHGKNLATLHQLTQERGAPQLLKRLNENEEILIETRSLLTAAVKAKRLITPGGVWLLDNFYLIEEQIATAKRHLPKSYHRQLPILASGPSAGLPRVYDIALETIAHGDGRIDPEILSSFVVAYQKVTPLKLGELWAIPIMLRLALIENLRRVASRIASGRRDRNLADFWADEMIEIAEKDPKNLILTVADMARSKLPLSSAFVAELTRRLQGQNPALALPMTWIKQWLSELGLTVEQMIELGNQNQAADQVSISNSIGSLRLLGGLDWRDFVEAMSIVEEVLDQDPGKYFPIMDFATRDRYRHVIEEIAKHSPLSEVDIAQKTVELAKEASAEAGADNIKFHVGYYLISHGRAILEETSQARFSWGESVRRFAKRFSLPIYMGAITWIAIFLSGVILFHAHLYSSPWALLIPMIIVLLLALSQLALELVNCFSTLLVRPRILPRMDFSDGIPSEFRTLVVVPTMITSMENIQSLVEAIEVRFLANPDKSLHFCLLTDLADANQEFLPEDKPLEEFAAQKIDELNQKYSKGRNDIFFFFHRPRRWNAQEKIWMGYERKRGKLGELNSFLRTGVGEFSLIVGETAQLREVKYVITLDTDTGLPRDCARGLVEAMAHPLNRARFDEHCQCVREGYGILQPRVSMSLPGANRSHYARTYAGEPGIDPYTRSVSDVYQDLFDEGSFIGKGIYDVDVVEHVLKDRFPEGRILSHDLVEGCYARSGLLSDVELFEEYPFRYLVDAKRRHRWIRGDWQLWGWLWSRVPRARGDKQKNTLSLLSQWKLVDNLRRSLVPVAVLTLFVLGWSVLSAYGLWTAVAVGIIFFPSLLTSFLNIFNKSKNVLLVQHLNSVVQSVFWHCAQSMLTLVCLPYEAYFCLDAVMRTIFRMTVTRRKLLEWNTSMDEERQGQTDLA